MEDLMTTVIVIGVILIALIIYCVSLLYNVRNLLLQLKWRAEDQQNKIDEIEYHLNHTIQNKLDYIESIVSDIDTNTSPNSTDLDDDLSS